MCTLLHSLSPPSLSQAFTEEEMNKFEEDYYDDYYDYEYDEHGNIIGFKDKPSHPQADQPPGIGLTCLL